LRIGQRRPNGCPGEMNSIYRQDRVKREAYFWFILSAISLCIWLFSKSLCACLFVCFFKKNYTGGITKAKNSTKQHPLLFTSSRESSEVPNKKQGPRLKLTTLLFCLI
jgi:hypothetical protein